MQWYNWFWFIFYSLHFITDFVTWMVTFYQLMLVVTGVMHEADSHLLNPEHLVVLSVGPIPHNSIHLLIITTDFVSLYWFTGYVVFIITSFLASVESRYQRLLKSKVLSRFSVVIMSIWPFFFYFHNPNIMVALFIICCRSSSTSGSVVIRLVQWD